MDPNATLAQLLDELEGVRRAGPAYLVSPDRGLIRDAILDHLDALTRWIEKGGFIPELPKHMQRGAR